MGLVLDCIVPELFKCPRICTLKQPSPAYAPTVCATRVVLLAALLAVRKWEETLTPPSWTHHGLSHP